MGGSVGGKIWGGEEGISPCGGQEGNKKSRGGGMLGQIS
jgi:hypothetical protein